MAKKNKIKLPKRIGGFKVPKAVRKAPLAAVLASPVAVGVIADMLYAGGTTLFEGGASGRRNRREAAHLAKKAPSRLPEAFAAAVQAFVETLRHGHDESSRDGHASRAFDDDGAPRHH